MTVRVHVQILDASDGSTKLRSDLDHDEIEAKGAREGGPPASGNRFGDRPGGDRPQMDRSGDRFGGCGRFGGGDRGDRPPIDHGGDPAAAPSSTAVAVALHPGPIVSKGNTRPIEPRKRPTRAYDMDFTLQCRVSSSAAPNAQRVLAEGQVKANMGCVDAAPSP